MENKMKPSSMFSGKQGQNYLFPFILVTSLFFLWGGFAHALLDVLNAHFQEILQISKARSALVQFALYGGYFVMGIPAGLIIKKYGYKKGIVFGLLVFAVGAFLFYPATLIKTFYPFLVALFVIACGLTCLETAANPYTTVLGPTESGARRINLAQSFNGLGWILGAVGWRVTYIFRRRRSFCCFGKTLCRYWHCCIVNRCVICPYSFTSDFCRRHGIFRPCGYIG